MQTLVKNVRETTCKKKSEKEKQMILFNFVSSQTYTGVKRLSLSLCFLSFSVVLSSSLPFGQLKGRLSQTEFLASIAFGSKCRGIRFWKLLLHLSFSVASSSHSLSSLSSLVFQDLVVILLDSNHTLVSLTRDVTEMPDEEAEMFAQSLEQFLEFIYCWGLDMRDV